MLFYDFHRIYRRCGLDYMYQYNASRHQWQAIAINVAGRDMPSLGGREVINYGRRITSELYDWLLEKKFITE